MKKLIQILLIVCGALLLNSCYYDTLVEIPIPEIPTDPDDPGFVEVKYGNDIQPIWDAKCDQCHNANHALDLRVDISYNELVPEYVIAGNAEGSRLYLKLETSHGGASSTDLTKIKAWIDQGAKDN